MKMGGCLSLKYGRYNQDLTGSTFSHYSLNSDSSYLDLYPALRYAETGASLSEIDSLQWRRSSVPLIQDWTQQGNSTPLVQSPGSSLATNHPALRPADSLTAISVKESSDGRQKTKHGSHVPIYGHGREESKHGFHWIGRPLASTFESSSTYLLNWEGRGGAMVQRLRKSTTLHYQRVEGDQDECEEEHHWGLQLGEDHICEKLGSSDVDLNQMEDQTQLCQNI